MKIPYIEILSDESYREVQPKQLARAILARFELQEGRDFQFSTGHLKEILFIKTVEVDNSKHILISCGLETVQEAIRMKKARPDIFSISILDPGKLHDKFDLIVLPSFDHPLPLENVITSTGLINNLNPEFLQRQLEEDPHEELKLKLSSLPKPRIAVLIGGLHNGGDFSVEDAKFLGAKLSNLVSEKGGSLMISTSRRTHAEPIVALKDSVIAQHHFYDYNYDGQDENPYYPMLAYAEAIVVTADSVRMCSEACSTGKPVFIYHPKELFFAYDEFCNDLIKEGYAKALTEQTLPGDIITPTKLLEEDRVLADKIMTKLG